MQIRPSQSPDESVTVAERANVNVTRVEISERTLAVLAFALAAAAIVMACWSMHDAHIAEREARMQQYYVLELDAKLIAAGIKKPDEAVAKKEAK